MKPEALDTVLEALAYTIKYQQCELTEAKNENAWLKEELAKHPVVDQDYLNDRYK